MELLNLRYLHQILKIRPASRSRTLQRRSAERYQTFTNTSTIPYISDFWMQKQSQSSARHVCKILRKHLQTLLVLGMRPSLNLPDEYNVIAMCQDQQSCTSVISCTGGGLRGRSPGPPVLPCSAKKIKHFRSLAVNMFFL